MAEVMCERRAKSLGKELPDRFWALPEWKKFFVYQASLISKLVRQHGRLVLLCAIIKKLDRRIWSVRHPAVLSAIEQTKKEIRHKKFQSHDKIPYLNVVDTSGIGRIYNSSTILDILDEFEA